MNKEYLVTKSNYFIMNSSYDLSLEEQRLILTLASMVQPDDEEFKPYIFKINDFMKLIGVDTKTKYIKIPQITKALMKKVFEIEEGNKILQVAWLSSVIYEKGKGVIILKFSPDLKPYMLKLNKLYTSYKLTNILNMKSKYSPRIYEILKANQFKKQNFIEIKIKDLRHLLKSETIYPLYADFKRKILKQTQKELNTKTDIKFEFEEIKTGRKVTSIRFYISNNKHTLEKNNTNQGIAATLDETNSNCNDHLIPEVQNIFYKHKVTNYEAECILKKSTDLEHIKECYRYALTQNVDNIMAYMLSLIDNYKKPQSNVKQDSFTDYEQRNYDFEYLEKKLLGWDKI